MNAYGEKFIDVDRFITYCKSLNVSTAKHELEHYEKIGAMMPVARVIYPRDYMIHRRKTMLHQSPSEELSKPSRWPEVDKLFDKDVYFLRRFNDLSDEELIDSFDREMGANSLLTQPTPADFRPWKEYIVRIPDGHGSSFGESSATHYYSYWQVHQLSLIKQFSELYKIRWLIELLPYEEKRKRGYLEDPNMDPFVEFRKKRKLFDALSFWLTMYIRERERTFAEIPKVFGIKRLDATQAAEYWKRLAKHAQVVTRRFDLDVSGLYAFLNQLLELLIDYRRRERYKLADELKKDIFEVAHLISCSAGHDHEAMEQHLANHSAHGRTFRHLFRDLKERDYAVEIIQYVVEHPDHHGKVKAILGWTDVEFEANGLLDYCEGAGLTPLITSLSEMVAVGAEERREKFRRVHRYTNLKSVLTSYEYFIKGIGEQAGLSVGGETLIPVLNLFMSGEPWMQDFGVRVQQRLTRAEDSVEFTHNLSSLQSDPALKQCPVGFWAGVFLVVCLSRNYTVHHYPNEDAFYNEPYGDILHSVILALCYTWKVAKSRGWV